MSRIEVVENVNINSLPAVDAKYLSKIGTEITIGDLHGNAMKLLFMLVKHGVAEIERQKYKDLVQIYKKNVNALTAADINKFHDILDGITWTPQGLMRLIGDEFCDRGSNDYFTLKILEKLHDHKVPYEVIFSNHGADFVGAYEKQAEFTPPMLDRQFAASMIHMQTLIDKGLVKRDTVIALINKAYKPALKALSYSLSEDNKEITIFSHAGIGIPNIEAVAKKIGVDYKDATAIELAETIEHINKKFTLFVQKNEVHTLYTAENMMLGYQGRGIPTDAAFEFMVWNRHYNISRPKEYNGYKAFFAHGHDSRDPCDDNVFNLDNTLGKDPRYDSGVYNVLYADEGPLVLKPKPEAEPEPEPEQENADADTSLNDEFLKKLFVIKDKTADLRKRNFEEDAKKAEELCANIAGLYEKYQAKELTLEAFQEKALGQIEAVREPLETHRGWKQIIGNVVLAILGLGVLYLAAACINLAVNNRFLFFRTESGLMLDQTVEDIHCFGAASAA